MSYTGATNYILDLRVVNMSSVAPVVVTVSVPTTLKEVFGLKPGNLYTVVVKVFRFYSVECSDTRIARTGQLKVCVCVCVRVKDGQKHICFQMGTLYLLIFLNKPLFFVLLFSSKLGIH